MERVVIVLLEALGLLVLAAGAGLAVTGLMPGISALGAGAGFGTAGVVVLLGTWLANRPGKAIAEEE